MEIHVYETMRIEGRLHSNGESGQGNTGGGGAGGSILAYVTNFDGEGSIEATGGRGRLLLELHFLPCELVFDCSCHAQAR